MQICTHFTTISWFDSNTRNPDYRMVRFKNRAVLLELITLDEKPLSTSLSNANFHEALRKAARQILGERATALCANMRIKLESFC